MTETTPSSKRLRVKWIVISLILYAVFYLLPLELMLSSNLPLGAIWVFAGPFLIAAVASYLSPGVTLWEPVIAGGGLVFLFFCTMMVLVPPRSFMDAFGPTVISLGIVFVTSVVGAWFGERAQVLWKKDVSEPTPEQ